jgi:hypothetical protein
MSGAAPRRRPRNTNGAIEPPFKVDRSGQPTPSKWAYYHQLVCPCERLSPWRKLPGHLRDNEFLLRGYRAVRFGLLPLAAQVLLRALTATALCALRTRLVQDWTLRQALMSVFQLHNETFNVWCVAMCSFSIYW